MPKTVVNLQALKQRLYNRVHKTGEECNNDLPNILRVVIEEKAWKQDVDEEGKPFKDLAAWLHFHWPSGLSVGCDSIAMTYAQLMAHCEGHKDVWDVLVKHAPEKGKPGPKTKDTNGELKEAPILIHRNQPTKATLAVRLQEKHPKHYEKYLRGEHKSITAAAVASGLVKEKTPLMRLKQYWNNASAEEREQFLAWIGEQNGGEL